jgi:hypothetical protein
MRLVYAVKVSLSPDVTYHFSQFGLWCFPEMAFGLIIVCVPMTPKFLKHWRLFNELTQTLKPLVSWHRAGTWPRAAGVKTHGNQYTELGRKKAISHTYTKRNQGESDSETLRGSQQELAIVNQIVRTIDIVTIEEVGASYPLPNHPPWNG